MGFRSSVLRHLLLVLLVWINASAQTIPPLPQVSGVTAGAIGGTFDVSDLGAATYTIPLAVPPGTTGMAPSLGLSYSSQGELGVLGTGWSLSGLSIITRCPTTNSIEGYTDGIDFDSNDKFCLDGQRLAVTSGTYGAASSVYRTMHETFAQVTALGQSGQGPASFRVQQKSGLTYEYGSTADARIESASGPGVLSWLLNRVEDRRGNAFTITYAKDTAYGETIPLRIDYTTNAGANLLPYNSVRFEYDLMPTLKPRYLARQLWALRHRMTKIAMYVGESVAWEYRLAYTTDTVKNGVYLASIEECGGQGECLPATTFDWGTVPSSGNAFSYHASLSDLTPYQGFPNVTQYPLVTGDWDGDGRSDLARASASQVFHCRATTGGFGSCGAVGASPWTTYGDGNTHPLATGDFTGDGRMDFLRADLRPATSTGGARNQWVLYYTPSGFNNIPMQSLPYPATIEGSGFNGRLLTGSADGDGVFDTFLFQTPDRVNVYTWSGSSLGYRLTHLIANGTPYGGVCDFQNCPVFIGDWNGDGLADIGKVGVNQVFFYVARGTSSAEPLAGFDLFATISDYSSAQGYSDVDTYPVLIGDWNGDGLTDFARVKNGGIAFRLSKGGDASMSGAGFGPELFFNDLGYPAYSNNTNYPIVTGDWNGDGTTDIARAHPNGILTYIVEDGVPQQPYLIPDLANAQGFNAQDTHPLFVGDWNGDGFSDIARVGQSQIKFYTHAASQTHVLQGIRDGLGARTLISYKPLTDSSVYTKGSGAQFPEANVQSPLLVVSRVTKTDNLSSTAHTSYTYQNLKVDLNGGGSSGFEAVSVRDEQSGITKRTLYSSDPRFRGSPTRVESRLANGTLIHKRENTWAATTYGAGRQFTYISVAQEFEYELNSVLTRWSQTDTAYDSWGNPTTITTTWHDNSRESTVNTYTNDTATWTIGQLTQTQVTKLAAGGTGGLYPAVTRTVAFGYVTGTGLLLSETVEPSTPALSLVKSYTYDTFGNVLTATVQGPGVSARTTTSTYDARGQFVTQQINALGHTNTAIYDRRHGKLIQQENPNGVPTGWDYDAFGRESMEYRPDGTLERTLYLQPTTGAPADAAYQVRRDVSGLPPEIVWYDAFSREIRSVHTGFDGRQIFKDQVYDDQSQLTHISEPYFEGDTPLWNASSYDAVGRVTQIVAPGNRLTTVQYNGLTTTTTNTLGQSTTQRVDAQGQTVEVLDALSHRVTFRHDPYGNVTHVIDDAGNTTIATYNVRGFRTQVQDPDTGTSTFQHNALGEITSTTNANGQTHQYTFDLLGRPLTRTSPEGQESWIYDAGPTGIGMVAQVNGLNGYQRTHSYDLLGRPTVTNYRIGGQSFNTGVTYDVIGRVRGSIYPSGFSVIAGYNANGFLETITRVDWQQVVWRATAMNARGQLEQLEYGNGITTNQSYDPTNGLTQRIQAGQVQDFQFQFDALGNLLQRADLVHGAVETFTYDTLNRLLSSQVQGTSPVTMTYDALGNILSRSDVGTYLYGGPNAGPHAVASITGPRANVYAYDAVGNRVSSSGGTIQYSSGGKPVVLTEGTARLEFDLDPSGDRVAERTFQNGALIARKCYVGASYEWIKEANGSREVHYLSTPDGPFAIYTIYNSTIVKRAPRTYSALPVMNYLHKDHLGSIQTITDENGKVVERLSFNSWGERRDPLSWLPTLPPRSSIDRGFTGHEHLDEVSLIHMNGRVFDPLIGRFVSADPFVQSPKDLQSLNRYSYVRNNPLSFTDPSGFFLRGFFRSVGRFLRKALPIAAAVAAAYFTGGFLSSAMLANIPALSCTVALSSYSAAIVGAVSGAGAGLASSVVGSVVRGGGFGAGFRSGLRNAPMSMLRGAVTGGIGEAFSGGGAMAGAPDVARVVAHGVAGGALSSIAGSSFASGFTSGLFGSIGASSDPVSAALLGGTASALSGGKFEDGAISSVFTYLYNEMGTHGVPAEAQMRGMAARALGPYYSGELPVYGTAPRGGSTFFSDLGAVATLTVLSSALAIQDLVMTPLFALQGSWGAYHGKEASELLAQGLRGYHPAASAAVGNWGKVIDGLMKFADSQHLDALRQTRARLHWARDVYIDELRR